MVIASEAGVLAFDGADIKEKGRLQPGKLLLVETEKGVVYHDKELKEQLAGAYPYREWLSKNRVKLDTISSGRTVRHDVADYPASLHTYPVGGHGWGYRDSFPYKRQWTGELEKWLREINK